MKCVKKIGKLLHYIVDISKSVLDYQVENSNYCRLKKFSFSVILGILVIIYFRYVGRGNISESENVTVFLIRVIIIFKRWINSDLTDGSAVSQTTCRHVTRWRCRLAFCISVARWRR